MANSVLPFDDRDGFIWYDGRLVPWRDAKLHVLTHGLHYASCVFEGERVYNGKVFRMEDHNERLINSAKILGFEVPASMDDLAGRRSKSSPPTRSSTAMCGRSRGAAPSRWAFRRRPAKSTWRWPAGTGRPISRRKRAPRASA